MPLCSALDLAVVRISREISFLIEPGERRSASEELAIEKGKLPTQVQVPSSNLAVGGISSAIDEAVIGLAWLGWSHWNSGLEEEGLL